MSDGKKPALRLEAFPIKLAIWENWDGKGRKYHSVKLTKVFKKEGSTTWEETVYLNDRDLLVAAQLLVEAWRTVAIKEPEQKPMDVPVQPKDDDNIPF